MTKFTWTFNDFESCTPTIVELSSVIRILNGFGADITQLQSTEFLQNFALESSLTIFLYFSKSRCGRENESELDTSNYKTL